MASDSGSGKGLRTAGLLGGGRQRDEAQAKASDGKDVQVTDTVHRFDTLRCDGSQESMAGGQPLEPSTEAVL